MEPIERMKMSEHTPPEGRRVLVAGGVAMLRNGFWFTGMEEPLFTRRLEWEPTWWAFIPTDN